MRGYEVHSVVIGNNKRHAQSGRRSGAKHPSSSCASQMIGACRSDNVTPLLSDSPRTSSSSIFLQPFSNSRIISISTLFNFASFKYIYNHINPRPNSAIMLFQSALSLLLQFCFLSLASAAPIEAARHGNAWQYGAGGGIVGFIVLILDIIVFSKFCQSRCFLAIPTSSCYRLSRDTHYIFNICWKFY
jgi:hypothetical protein